MKNGFDTILDTGDLLKRGGMAAARNAGKVTAVIALFVSALVLFADIGFADFETERFTATLAVMLTASYLTYFSMEESGEEAGCETPEYKAAAEKHLALSERIDGSRIAALRAFCREYTEDEVKYRREAYLTSRGYTKEEYERYKSGEKFPRRAMRVFRRSEALRSATVTPRMLLARERIKRKSELSNPESFKILSLFIKLIPTTVCMLMTVSIILTTKEGLTAGAVMDGIFKLSSLPIIAFKGYAAGYSYKKHTAVQWLETRSRILDNFLANKSNI